MAMFLAEVAARHPTERIVMIVDGAGWHKSQQISLPAPPRLMFLPPYSPELNPVEHLWEDPREKFFHDRVFASIEALEDRLVDALLAYEHDPARVHSITAWIISAL
jgi:transposase